LGIRESIQRAHSLDATVSSSVTTTVAVWQLKTKGRKMNPRIKWIKNKRAPATSLSSHSLVELQILKQWDLRAD
jgi:hypothetical protein